MKVSDRLQTLRRIYPHTDKENARFLYATKRDLRKSGESIVVYLIVWSEDRRVSVHSTIFDRAYRRTVPEWADWLREHAPRVLSGQVLANLNRTYGSIWSVDRVVGWTFRKD